MPGRDKVLTIAVIGRLWLDVRLLEPDVWLLGLDVQPLELHVRLLWLLHPELLGLQVLDLELGRSQRHTRAPRVDILLEGCSWEIRVARHR